MSRHHTLPVIPTLVAAALALAAPARAATPVAVANPGFEDPVLADGASQNTVPGWSSGRYDVSNPGVWITGATGTGVQNVSTAEYTSGLAPEGQNMAFATSATGFDSGLGQVLAATLQPDADYALTVKIGNPFLLNGGLAPDYRIELLAGGVLLASTPGSPLGDDSDFVTATINFNSAAAAPTELGQPLEIRLLATDFTSGLRVDFDHVQLTLALANPVAVPGGPYLVAIPDGSLSLDGSGSLPSGGATAITAWEWDLNINDNGGAFNADATGATPAAIDYATLTSTHGMVEGANTIRLRVTDDSSPAKTSIAETIVTLAEPPVTLTWDHNADGTASDGSGTWLNANQWLDGANPATWDNLMPNNAIIGSGGAGGTITLGAVTAGTVLLDNFTGTYGLSGGSLDQSGGITVGANAGHVNILTEVKGTGGITINGPSRVNLRGGGNNSFSGDLVVTGGGEALDDDFVNIGTGNLHLNGGAYVNYWQDTLTRTLGTGAGEVQLPGGASGFTGQGRSGLTVRLNNNANYEVVWGGTHFNPSTLVLQTPWANTNGKVVWQNPIDLNGTHRTIAVNKDHGNGGGFFNDGYAQMSGVIDNKDTGNPAGIIKTGPGRLILSATNTYDGGTTVNGGSVEYTTPAAIPPTGSVVFNDGTELWVRVGGANQFTADSSGAGSLGGLLGGISFSGAVDLVLRPSSTPNYLGSIPSSITDLWIFGGNMTLSGTGAYTGSTIIGQRGGTAITVTLGSATALPSGTPVTVDSSGTSRLDLNGHNATIGQFRAGSNNGTQKGTITDTLGGGVLTLTNGIFVDGHNDGGGAITTGTVDLNGTTQTFEINNNRANTDLLISSNIQNGGVIIKGGGTISQTIFTGNSTYTGGTTVQEGILTIDGSLADATMAIEPGATVNGTGTLTFNAAAATIDQIVMTGGTLNAAGLTVNVSGSPTEAEYVIVDATAGGTVSGTFAGLTGTSAYALDYGTANQVKLVRTASSPYTTWAATNAPTGDPDDDFDGDGVPNAIEFVLGGDKDTNDLAKLPKAATTPGGDMTFTFIRDQDSVDPSVGTVIEVGTDLATWPQVFSVGADTAGSSPGVTVTDNLDGTDTITLTTTMAPDDTKFARLNVTVTTL
jgi:autotransporter-associated beta strand protein